MAINYLNDKAAPFVLPLAKYEGAEIIMPFDVNKASTLEAVSDEITARWGRLDVLLHSTVFAPKLRPKVYGAPVESPTRRPRSA